MKQRERQRLASDKKGQHTMNIFGTLHVNAAHPNASLTLAASATLFFLVSIDTLIVNVALPSIAQQLGGNMAARQWVMDGYTLTFASFLLLMGSLVDKLGADRVFKASTAAFCASSIVCALAQSMGALVAGRVLLGVSAAGVMSSSMAVINNAYVGGKKRAQALGIWMSAGSVAAAAGPLFGGLLVPLHWSLIFLVNVPFCLAALVFARSIAPSPRRAASFDLPGQVLSTAGLVLLVGAVIEGGSVGYGHALVIAAALVGVVLLAAFVTAERTCSHPMLPLALFTYRNLNTSSLAGFCFIGVWFGIVFITSAYLQDAFDLGPLAAGLAFAPSAVTSFAGNLLSGKVTARFGAKLPLVAGFAIQLASMGIAAVAGIMGAAHSYALVVVMLVVLGFGGSITMPAASNLVLQSAPLELSGIASAAFNTFRQVGASIAIALFGSVASMASSWNYGLTICFVVAGALSLTALLAAVRLKKTPADSTDAASVANDSDRANANLQRVSSANATPCYRKQL